MSGSGKSNRLVSGSNTQEEARDTEVNLKTMQTSGGQVDMEIPLTQTSYSNAATVTALVPVLYRTVTDLRGTVLIVPYLGADYGTGGAQITFF